MPTEKRRIQERERESQPADEEQSQLCEENVDHQEDEAHRAGQSNCPSKFLCTSLRGSFCFTSIVKIKQQRFGVGFSGVVSHFTTRTLSVKELKAESQTGRTDMAQTLYDVKPEPGDLIEVFRGTYQHWAVYVGDGFVVHLAALSEVAGAGSSSMMSVLSDEAIVKKEKLCDVVGKDKWEINNSLDKKYTPRPVEVIVKEAYALVGRKQPYSIIRKNCEHFVNDLRYGKPESLQVCKAGETVMYAGIAAAVGLGVVALAGALFGGSKKEKEDKQ